VPISPADLAETNDLAATLFAAIDARPLLGEIESVSSMSIWAASVTGPSSLLRGRSGLVCAIRVTPG
jgi:hypothetical protein